MIHAIIKKQQITKFQRLIVPGVWRIFEHFTLTKASGKFRGTDHAYWMSIINITSIVPCASVSDDMFLKLVSFEDIHHESKLSEFICIGEF